MLAFQLQETGTTKASSYGLPAFVESATDRHSGIDHVSTFRLAEVDDSRGAIPIDLELFESEAQIPINRVSFADKRPQETRHIVGIPNLKWQTPTDPALSDVVRKLVQKVWAVVVSKALHSRFPLEASLITVFEDPVSEDRKPVLRIYCNANAAQAIAFWKSLEENFQNLLQTLKGNDRETFLRKLDLTIHWR
jgi:hypothetical protein